MSTVHATIAQPNEANIPVMIELSKLRRSKKNMRTIHPRKSAEDDELLASIRSKGLFQNLIVYPVGELFEVPGGGRRFGALELLHKEGVIPDDYGVSCLVIPEEDATDASLIENLQRKAPHPADVFTAFSVLIKDGKTVADIARTHGISELQVEKYLRLGKVHKTLFNLYKKDRLTLDQMMAFASTPDTKLQISTFKAIGEDCGYQAQYIRQRLQENRHSSDTALAKLVTVDAYQKAGGKLEHDFFEDCAMLLDVELLVKLAEEKLNEEAAKIKGWKWVKTSMEGAYVVHDYQRLPSKKLPTPKSDEAALKKLTDQLDKLEAIDDDSWTDTHQEKYGRLEEDIDELSEKIDRECTGFHEKHLPFGGCIVTFSQSTGEIEVHEGLMTKEDVSAFQSKGKKSPEQDAQDSDKPKLVTKPELSAAFQADLGLYRRSIIKAELAANTGIAVDLLHYQTCLAVLGEGMQSYTRILDVSFSTVSDESSKGDYKQTEAAKTLASRYTKLDTGWLSIKTEQKQFAAFRALSSSKRQALVSYCVAVQLLQGNSVPKKEKLIESIVDEIGIDFTKYWRPSGENYFSRLTIPLLLSHGKRWYGPAWVKQHAKASKKALVAGFHQVFNGSKTELSEKEQDIKSNWIPKEIAK